MCVDRAALFMCLKALLMMLFIRDLSKSCRVEVYSVEKCNVSFWFLFYCFVDSVVFSTSSETSLHWSHRLVAGHLQCKVRLIHCKVLLYCIWKVFEAIVMFWGYSNSLVFT